MKLELKHLAGYLPYGLKMYDQKTTGIRELKGFTSKWKASSDLKPILRPLSDLTKFCEVLGFVPIERLDDLESDVCSYSLDYYINHTKRLPFYRVQKLLEWHFDIHNLIENNLAIDINTL